MDHQPTIMSFGRKIEIRRLRKLHGTEDEESGRNIGPISPIGPISFLLLTTAAASYLRNLSNLRITPSFVPVSHTDPTRIREKVSPVGTRTRRSKAPRLRSNQTPNRRTAVQ